MEAKVLDTVNGTMKTGIDKGPEIVKVQPKGVQRRKDEEVG